MPAFSRHEVSELCILSRPRSTQRAQGTPDAGRTREPCVQRKVHFAHASNDRAAGQSGVPCAVVYGLLRALPGDRAFFVTVTPEKSSSHELDASIGAPGPHDFAVRDIRRSSPPSSRPPHPTARIVTCATPLVSGETGEFVQLICPTGSGHQSPSIPASENISVFQKLESGVLSVHPASLAEGRIAVVTKREAGMRWT